MFGSQSDNKSVHWDTVISAKTEIVGNLTVSGALHIDGIVKGNLIAEAGSKAIIRVSEKGRVIGDITAPNVVINGDVKGDVCALEHLELAQKGRVNGNVYYTTVEMVLGGQVNGQMKHLVDAEHMPDKVVALISDEKIQEEANG